MSMYDDNERAAEALTIILGTLFLVSCTGVIASIVLALAKFLGTTL